MEKIISMIKWLFGSRRRTVALVIIILVVGFFFLRGRATTPKTVTQTGTVTKGTLVVSLSASGQVSALNNATVDTSATGVVKKVYVTNGQSVKAGQPIIELTLDQDSTQKYLSALASYNSAKNSLNTLQASSFAANQKFMNDAVARNLETTDPTYIQENAAWLAAEAAYNNQQNSIGASLYSLRSASPVVYAPIAGTVNGLSLTVGAVIASQSSNSNAASSQKIASIVTGANPTISLNLTQIDAPKVKVGDKATVTLDAFADKTYTGKVVSIDITGTVSSGVTNYPTVIQLDTQNPEMYPNMSATANIILDTKSDVLLIPSTAITNSSGSPTVKLIKNGQTVITDITTGETDGTNTEVVSGLSEGDTIVTSIQTQSTTSTTSTGTSVFSSLGRGGFGGGNVVRVRGN